MPGGGFMFMGGPGGGAGGPRTRSSMGQGMGMGGGMPGMPGMGMGMGGGMPGMNGGRGGGGPHAQGPPPKPPAIQRPLLLTLEELFTGTTKRLKITRRRGGRPEDKVGGWVGPGEQPRHWCLPSGPMAA